MQPHLHDIRNWTLQTLRVQNSINVILARSKITYVVSMVMEEWQRPSSWHWLNAVSALRQKCVSEAVCLDAQLHEPRYNIKVWPCHQERSPVFSALWRTGTKDTRCLLTRLWMWPGLHLTYWVCILALSRKTTTGMCWHMHFRNPDILSVAQHRFKWPSHSAREHRNFHYKIHLRRPGHQAGDWDESPSQQHEWRGWPGYEQFVEFSNSPPEGL
jgi:hypothetical protein